MDKEPYEYRVDPCHGRVKKDNFMDDRGYNSVVTLTGYSVFQKILKK